MTEKVKTYTCFLCSDIEKSVINAWARAGAPTRAEDIFRVMLQDFSMGNEAAKPTTSTYNSKCHANCFTYYTLSPSLILRNFGWNITALIKAWGFSKRADAAERSEAILKEMQDMEQNSSGIRVSPNVRTYTALILCYGLSRRPGAPQRAAEIVRQMDEDYRLGKLSEGPNKRTFVTLRKAWSSSNEANKEVYAAAVQREIDSRFRLGSA